MKSVYTTIEPVRSGPNVGCWDLVAEGGVTLLFAESHSVCEAVQEALEFPDEVDPTTEAYEVANNLRAMLMVTTAAGF